jgi:hypothetical protein
VQNAADHPSIIDPTSAQPTLRQVRLDDGPGFVTQPVEIIHGRLLEAPRRTMIKKSDRSMS